LWLETPLSDASWDEADDFERAFSPRPARPSRPGHRKKKRRKSKKFPAAAKIALGIAGGVAGLLLLIFLAVNVVRLTSVPTLEMDEPLAYLTVDTEMIVSTNFDEFRRNTELDERVRAVLASDEADLEEFATDGGLDSGKDIVLIAYGTPNSHVERGDSSLLPSGGIVVIQSRKPWNRRKVALGEITKSCAGKTYLRDRIKTDGVYGAMFFANEYTMILASEETIRKLLKMVPPSLADSGYAFADFNSSVVTAYRARPDEVVPRELIQTDPDADHNEVALAAQILPTRVQGLSIARSVVGNYEAKLQAECADPGAARRLVTAVSGSPETRREIADFLVFGFWDGQPGVVEESLRHLQIKRNGATVTFSTHFEQTF